jgi:hypothetical protein
MRRFMLERSPATLRCSASLAAVLLALGCNRAAPPPAGQAAGPRPTPAPTFTLPIDSSSHAALLAYAHGLAFDTTVPAVDRRYLVVAQGQRLSVGPFVELAPEIGAAAISHADLARGRILARVKVDGTRPFIGTAVGTAYLWVDSAPGGFREVIVPEAAAAPLTSTPVMLAPYGSATYCANLAVARINTQRVAGPAADPPGAPAVMGTTSTARIVCYPCNCTICCSDTTSKSFSPIGMGAAVVPTTPDALQRRADSVKAH